MLSLSLQDNALAERAQASLRPAQVNPVIGRAASNTFKNHFDLLEQKPNKLGGPRQHFWSQARRSTNFQVISDGAIISVSQIGVRQRLLGGEIKPVKAKSLAIPARAESYGKLPREFSDLRFAILKPGGPVLIDKAGAVMFWLKKSVVQEPDPDVIPSQDDLRAAITKALRSQLARNRS